MLLNVPLAPRFRMTDAPLVQALAQVTFPLVARLESVSGIAPLQEALADDFPYMNRNVIQQVSMLVGPAGPAAGPATEQTVVYEFTDDDGWTLSVTVASATLAVGAEYQGVEHFASRLAKVIDALRNGAGVRRCDRIGVRYLDVVEVGHDSSDWGDWFRPELIGVASPSISAGTVTAALTEVRLQQAADSATSDWPLQGIIRYGLIPPDAVMAGVPPRPVKDRSFVLDMDTFILAPQPFDSDKLVESFRSLHAEIESLFYWTLTERGKARFGLELEGV
jgi:uncharacterized protein (TIGR04255 family)